MSSWVRITETLPNPFKLVALMDSESWQSMGGNIEDQYPVSRIGYLNDFRGRPFWSCYGERPIECIAFTHWTPLPRYDGLNCFGDPASPWIATDKPHLDQ